MPRRPVSIWLASRLLAAAAIVALIGVGALIRLGAPTNADLTRPTVVVESADSSESMASAAQQPEPRGSAAPTQVQPTLTIAPIIVSATQTSTPAPTPRPSNTPVAPIAARPTVAPTQTPITELESSSITLETATPLATATTPPTAYRTYVVQRGDMLKQIAARYGVTMASIIAINTIPNPDSLQVGQVLRIPPAGN